MDVVIVESPAKAKTIEKYLGGAYRVFASYGHVRDLPESEGSVDPDADFAMLWEQDATKSKRMSEIVQAVKKADRLVLATDPDREGEAISWHVLEILRQKKALRDQPICRVVFNAITKKSVLDAMAAPRQIDQPLVDAYLARRALDYLVGFNLSPVLWRKLPGARSAGRVQSVALRLVCERENEIDAFTPREYWTVDADFKTAKGKTLPARLTHHQGEKLDKFSLPDEASAQGAHDAVAAADFRIAAVETKPGQRRPPPPFTTSTLQQEASRKFGFSARQTMQSAQKLYEGVAVDGEVTGLITYMRTDGQDIAAEAVSELRDTIKAEFGGDYLPDAPRKYAKTAANAQEAHEAIRPTSAMRTPQQMAALLDSDQRKLYELIWKRALACQMENARVQRTSIEIASDDGQTALRATGTVITFAGFLQLYEEGRDDEKSSDDDKDGPRLPAVEQGERLATQKVTPAQHFTEPPPRYSEASLVKKMEELGIGRPSTYASILQVLRERDYVAMERKRFIAQDKGRLVTAFLENFFTRYVQYEFTADLEGELDKVSNGDIGYREVLARFWKDFAPVVNETLERRNTEILDRMNEVLGGLIFKGGTNCPKCKEGELSLKTGRFGAFVGCTRYPDCRFTRPFAGEAAARGDIERLLGEDPDSGREIWLKDGRFGPYIERAAEGDEKPKRVGLPKDMKPDTLEFAFALQLLSLPRNIGTHPESGEEIIADLGRYGPYIKAGKQSASLTSVAELFELGVNRAVTLIAERKTKGPAQARGGNIIKELGAHPEDQKPINVLDGRFGPYVKYDKINATIPKDEDPKELTLERGLELIAARIARGSGKKRSRAKSK